MGNQSSHNGMMPVALDERMERTEPSHSQPSSEDSVQEHTNTLGLLKLTSCSLFLQFSTVQLFIRAERKLTLRYKLEVYVGLG